MATKKDRNDASDGAVTHSTFPTSVSSTVDELLLAALERGDDGAQTGRFLITYKEGAGDEALNSLKSQGMRVADARDFENQAATMEDVGDADALFLPEIGVALVSGDAAQERSMGIMAEIAADSPVESIDPEYFVFADEGSGGYMPGSQSGEAPGYKSSNGQTQSNQVTNEYLRGFLRAAEMISRDLKSNGYSQKEIEEEVQVLGATWGLIACKVPPSIRSGAGIKVAILGTGLDLDHPDFVGRPVVSKTFVGQPVQDLNGHSTHLIGTACGPKAPVGTTPRYGIGFRTSIFIGKVLSNSGSGTQAGVLAGMNWAISNRCPVILATMGSSAAPHPAYTAAGQAALNNGCLMIAPAGSSNGVVGAPANSSTIISVAAVDPALKPTLFSNSGKIDIAAPGVNIFSSSPRPRRYSTISGTSSAAAHVAGCAALWAETSPMLRGLSLWKKLEATAKRYPPFFPPYPPKHPKLGAGLVQAP